MAPSPLTTARSQSRVAKKKKSPSPPVTDDNKYPHAHTPTSFVGTLQNRAPSTPAAAPHAHNPTPPPKLFPKNPDISIKNPGLNQTT
ncbi:hypothetical protein pdul_cds_1063 [Pandoravirus dulcis]|uniref:Uncharacterized protein n=1 Tax=Pandoravirus dulcis TaxID=1349409 RepID=A0A291AU88_9VIRU|nr:hypothetical protein pdul_cds_1063 [Pandoravirus dulcis]ATE82583.1 hypothetical protein pdul_cds_1063 [Pandoravirus dulcis]